MTKVVTCGTKTSDVQFEFTSPDYPAALPNQTAQCELTVSHDCKNPVCQLRIDLVDFRLGPPLSGDCDDDQFIVRANDPVPTLCGDNSGQHLYVDVRGRSETNLNLLTMPIFPKPVGVHNETNSSRTIIQWLNEVDPQRGWKMMITQLPCDCSVSGLTVPRAPTGCLQFHTGITGEITSFNYDGTISNYEPCWNGTEAACGAKISTGHLNNLDYTVCVQSEPGYCAISYKQEDAQAFQMSGLRTENVPSPWNGESKVRISLFVMFDMLWWCSVMTTISTYRGANTWTTSPRSTPRRDTAARCWATSSPVPSSPPPNPSPSGPRLTGPSPTVGWPSTTAATSCDTNKSPAVWTGPTLLPSLNSLTPTTDT